MNRLQERASAGSVTEVVPTDPLTAASQLAPRLERETQVFKADARKLERLKPRVEPTAPKKGYDSGIRVSDCTATTVFRPRRSGSIWYGVLE